MWAAFPANLQGVIKGGFYLFINESKRLGRGAGGSFRCDFFG
jgi:hypothetical protein